MEIIRESDHIALSRGGMKELRVSGTTRFRTHRILSKSERRIISRAFVYND